MMVPLMLLYFYFRIIKLFYLSNILNDSKLIFNIFIQNEVTIKKQVDDNDRIELYNILLFVDSKNKSYLILVTT